MFMILELFIFFCVTVALYGLTSFYRNKVVGCLWLLVSAGWFYFTTLVVSGNLLPVYVAVALFLSTGIAILYRKQKLTYLLWAIGLLVVCLVVVGTNKLVGIVVLIAGVCWIYYRRKSFVTQR